MQLSGLFPVRSAGGPHSLQELGGIPSGISRELRKPSRGIISDLLDTNRRKGHHKAADANVGREPTELKVHF